MGEVPLHAKRVLWEHISPQLIAEDLPVDLQGFCRFLAHKKTPTPLGPP
jgi:hypothetical protein